MVRQSSARCGYGTAHILAGCVAALLTSRAVTGSAGGAWPTYHGGESLAGYASTPLDRGLIRRWRVNVGGRLVAPPVGSAARLYVVTEEGVVVALDAEGRIPWRTSLPPGEGTDLRVSAPLLLAADRVIAGTEGGALHALAAKDGKPLWRIDLGGEIRGTPNLAHTGGAGRILVVTQPDGVLHAVNPLTGAVEWKTKETDRCDGSPSVKGSTVVFGSCAAALHVFSAADGAELGVVELGDESQVAGGVAQAGDFAFAGTRAGGVVCANVATVELLWTFDDLDAEVFSTPAVAGADVVFGADDGVVYCVGRDDGRRRWAFETEGMPLSPVVTDDKVLVSADGVLYLLQRSDGRRAWSYDLGSPISSPAVIGRLVLVCGEDGYVTAFGPNTEH